MSRHGTPGALWSLLLLGGVLACATTSKLDRHELAADHVYLGSKEELVDRVTRVLLERGLKVVRSGPDSLRTPWVALNVPRTVAGSNISEETTALVLFESYRVKILDIDENHHRLRVERGTATSLLSPENARSVVVRQATGQGEDSSGSGGLASSLALPSGTTTAPEFVPDAELEWALVQALEPTAAAALAYEETVVNGGVEAPPPLPPPPPPLVEAVRACLDIPGVDPLLATRRLVLLGELQGTQQAPQFLGGIACRAAAQRIPVALGLELPHQGNAALEAYLASAGAARDRRAYLETETWQRDWQDGRSSMAMFALIEQVRALRKAGADILVAGIDDRAWLGEVRDRAMAENIESMRRRTLDRPMLVLMGNLHASTELGNVAPGYVPLGARLESFGLRPVSLVMAYDKGTIWSCTHTEGGGCGVHAVPGWPPGDRMSEEERVTARTIGWDPWFGRRSFVRLWKARTKGFDGVFYVGPVTASGPPDRDAAAGHESDRRAPSELPGARGPR